MAAMKRRAALAVLLLALVAAGAPPEPVGIRTGGEAQAYVAAAERWLRDNSGDARVPRVLSDVIIVADAVGNPQVAQLARGNLIFRYGTTPQAVFAARGIGDIDQFSKFVQKMVGDLDGDGRAAARAVLSAFDAASNAYGEAGETDPYLVTAAALALPAALGESQIDAQAAVLGLFSEGIAAIEAESWQDAAAIVADASLPPVDRLVRLNALARDGDANAKALVDVAEFAVTGDARDREDVRRIRLRRAIDAERWSVAAAIASRLIDEHDAGDDVRLFRGYSLAADGQLDAAARDLRAVESDAAAALLLAVELPSEQRNEYAAMLDRLRQTMLDVEQVELLATYEPSGEPAISAYLLDRGDSLTLHLSRAGELTLAAERRADSSGRLLVPDGPTRDYSTGVPMPIFTYRPDTAPGRGAFNVSFSKSTGEGIGDPAGGFSGLVRRIANDPALAANVVGFVSPAKGLLPLPPVTTGSDGTRLAWIGLDDEGRPIRRTATLDAAGRLASVSGDVLTVTDLRYGPADAFEPSPPAWPESEA